MQSLKELSRAFLYIEKKIHSTATMPKAKKEKSNSKTCSSVKDDGKSNGAVYVNAKNEVILQIHAKPGAKESAITDIDNVAVSVQIGAPPMDGEANKELIRYLAEVLKLRKSDLVLDKGSRSREKKVILSKDVSLDDVINALNAACK